MPVAPPARVLCGLGAALAALFLLVLSPALSALGGRPWAALAMVLVTLPYVAFLGAVAFAPEPLQRLLSRHTALDLSQGRHVGAAALMATTLLFTIGLGSLAGGVLSLESALAGEEPPEVDAGLLWAGLTQNLFVLTLPPVAYVALVHGGGLPGALRALGFRREGWARDLLVGAGVAIAFIVALAIVSYALSALGVGIPENEVALGIARSVNVAGALAIAVVTALSEEVFFRGFLQPRVGLLAQAVLFALAHLAYVNAVEVVVTLSLGLAFGLLMRRTGSLWGPIGGHFTFNLVMLLSVLALDASGGGG